ncbi:MAG: DUF2752 domain-containing protein [Pyrinomonadaceae bacterium]|nr:DUF2752 domain-containing protein [Pyrinomonadaceae bacterium]
MAAQLTRFDFMQVMNTTFLWQPAETASWRARLLGLMIVAGSIFVLVYLRLFNPATPGTNMYPSCPFHSLTGLNCPGCGTLRGLHQLMHGHLLSALNHNVLMVLMLPFFAYTLVSYALVATRGRGLPKPFVRPLYLHTLLWAVLSFWVLRNIPVYPLTLLSP